MNEDRFVGLLRRLVALGERMQNAPDAGMVPEERLGADEVEALLRPHVDSGFLQLERLAAEGFENRPSLVITVPGTEPDAGTIGFVGAHFDVVPADREAEGWNTNPFELVIDEGGTMYGRGVTDCLGHVALVTDLLVQLAETGARPRRTLRVVFISNEEEAPIAEIGLDWVVGQGYIDDLKRGPVYWLDSADFGPTVGTGGVWRWQLTATGVPGHSGMMHNCVNALELGMAATLELVRWFREEYPPHPDEQRYGFLSSSTLKPTVVRAANDKITKVPGKVSFEGDIRLTPFYELPDAIDGARAFIAELDRKIESGELPDTFPRARTASGDRGRLALEGKGRTNEGIACKLDSPGLSALRDSIRHVCGETNEYALTGSLPLVRSLQRAGFDVQICGFGVSSAFHAPNEHGRLDDFRRGFQVLRELLVRL